MNVATEAVAWIDALAGWSEGIDGWVVDQFGVLHDGRHPYPAAADALRRLVARGDTVLILSNSGKRNPTNEARLAARGFGPDCHSGLLTSGELTHRLLAQRSDPFFAALGPRCWLVANDGDRSVTDGLPIEVVADIAAADFVLLAGTDGAPDERACDSAFRVAIARGLPAICANPDLLRLDGGALVVSCGALARRYEQLGGRVRWIGKPHPDVYGWCTEQFARRGTRRIAMIGDSLEHDVAGAQRAGWLALLVAGGLHREVLDGAAAPAPALRRLVREHGLPRPPDAVIAQLRW